MSDSGEKKTCHLTDLGADMALMAARVGSGYRILIPRCGGSNPPAPAKNQCADFFYRNGFFSRGFSGPFGMYSARHLEISQKQGSPDHLTAVLVEPH
jgi:hypothetical protein